MAIVKWKDPIYERQEGEADREYHYLEPYFTFPGNLKEYAEFLECEFNRQHETDLLQTCDKYEKYLEKHPILFHAYDIKKGKPPSLDQIQHWSSGVNTKGSEKKTWNQRRSSFIKSATTIGLQVAGMQFIELLVYMMTETQKGFKEVNDGVETDKSNDNFTSHKAEAATKARLHVIESVLKLIGKDKDFNVNTEVSGELNIDSNVDVRHHSVAEDIILNPAYAELTRKLLEDVANEEGTDSK